MHTHAHTHSQGKSTEKKLTEQNEQSIIRLTIVFSFSSLMFSFFHVTYYSSTSTKLDGNENGRKRPTILMDL
jgi:hypothetical protein